MIITPSTELDAVNEILSSVGSSPVNNLEDDCNVDVLNAVSVLKAVSKEVQTRGYSFNTQTNVYLQSDAAYKRVPFRSDFLKVAAPPSQYVRREGWFYDVATQESEFPDGITLKELVVELPFEELPQVFRKYITTRASRIFQMRYLTSTDLDNHLQIEEAAAYADIVDYDLLEGNYNILSGDMFISQQIQRS